MRQQQSYSVSELMWNTLGSLVDDFRTDVPMSMSSLVSDLIRTRDVSGLRAVEADVLMELPSSTMKRCYQMSALFKRVITKQDNFTWADLEKKAIADFLCNQSRLRDFSYQVPKHFGPALSFARGICHDILGEWCTDEHLSLCRHGKHAAFGVPLRRAKLDAKWLSVSGSGDQHDWFVREYLSYHDNAREYFANHSVYETVMADALRMSFVPKSFKAVRSITPNTVVGALHSDGLGKMITRRLLKHGLDIASLQERHRNLAKEASICGHLVTCDQSSASDNITFRLLELLLPRTWLDRLAFGRIPFVDLPDGSRTQLESFCTMGIGFTFPLQTLVFYSLARGIELQFSPGTDTVSCYGDDLIFGTQLWPFFKAFTAHLGLQINSDKSFFYGPFRESCGGDFHRGVDVRPFQPKWTGSDLVSRETYESLLYRFINGIRRRWCDEEVESTLLYLLSEVERISKRPCLVPFDFPDTSGIRISALTDWISEIFSLKHQRNRNGALIFSYLRPLVKDEKVLLPSAYLWASLQDGAPLERFSLKYRDLVPIAPVPGSVGFRRHRATTVIL